VSECVFFLERETDRTAHEPAGEGLHAHEQCIHVGSIGAPWCSHEVGERGFRNPPRTRLHHHQTLSRSPQSLKQTLEFPFPNPPTRGACQDQISKDLLEDSDNAGAGGVEITLKSLFRQLGHQNNLTQMSESL